MADDADRVWVGSMPDAYEHGLAPAVFRLFAIDLGRRVAAHAPQRVLELATGTGVLTRELIASQFGVMFFPDKHAALSDARRVLTADGHLVLNTWAALDAHDFQGAMVDVLERMFPDDPPTFCTAMPHGYADPDVVVRDLRAANFHRVDVEAVTHEGRADSAHALTVGYRSGTPVRAAIEARADLQGTTDAITKELELRSGTGEAVGRLTAYLFEASE